MDQNILADIPKEGQSLEETLKGAGISSGDDKEKGTPSDSPADNKPKEGEAASSGAAGNTQTQESVPFHKHPRWIEREAELQELKQFKEEALQRFDEIDRAPIEQNIPIPKWFHKMYGDDAEAWQDYLNDLMNQREALKAEIFGELSNQAAQQAVQQRQAETFWNNWVDNQVQGLRSEGLQFDKNELLKTALDFKPTDMDGNIDLRVAYEILQKTKGMTQKEKSGLRKEIADKTSSRASGEATKNDFQTSESLRNVSWNKIGKS